MEGNLKQMLKTADENGYAIPAFNYSDIWDMLAIVRAAEEENAPIMLASNQLVVNEFGADLTSAMGAVMMKRAKVPVVHHLDHSWKVEYCLEAIDCGYPSVMIDGSQRSLEENIDMVKRVVEYGRPKGVHVEGEIGKIKGKGVEGDFKGGAFLAEVEDVLELVKQAQPDSLAIGIGTAHGFYEGKPEINFERLEEINKATDVPLVLHGGTGIPEEDIQKAISLGINKVNVGTIVHCTYMNNMKKELSCKPENQYTHDITAPVVDEIVQVVRKWIRVIGANGKA